MVFQSRKNGVKSSLSFQTFIGNNGRPASTRAKEHASSGRNGRFHMSATAVQRIDSLLVHAVTLTLLVRKFVVAICKQDLSRHLQSPKRKHLCRFVVTEQFHAGTPRCDSHPIPSSHCSLVFAHALCLAAVLWSYARPASIPH